MKEERLRGLFDAIKQEVFGWKIFKPRKPFSQQKGGFRKKTTSIARTFLSFISGGECETLAKHLCSDTPTVRKNPKPKISIEKIEQIQNFMLEHSQPAANNTTYDKKTKAHIPKMVYHDTLKNFHKEYNNRQNQSKISYSKFLQLKPVNLKPANRKIDMCSLCLQNSK